MKKLAMLILIVALGSLMPGVLEAGKKPKTGIVKDQKYTDLRFGFEITFPKDWKIGKPRKEYTAERIIAEQKNARIPIKLRADPSWATKPTVMIFADSSELTAEQFFTFVQADTGKSKFKRKIGEKTILLAKGSRYNIEIRSKQKNTVAGFPALEIQGDLVYDAEIYSSSRRRPQIVRDYKSGIIYVIKFPGWTMFVEMVGENKFFDSLQSMFASIIETLKLVTVAEIEKEK